MTPDEVRLLDNGKAILFVRGERPMVDEKYDLLRHPNICFTEDGGAPLYDYAATKAKDDAAIDRTRLNDYELLDAGDFLGPSSNAKPRRV